MRPLRIGVVVPPMLAVPPSAYAGTERVVACLVEGLVERGHRLTVFAAGDSTIDCEVVPVIERSLWSTGYRGDVCAFIDLAAARAWREQERFDIIHSHLGTAGFMFARHAETPVLSTLHGRLDIGATPALMAEFTDVPLVAISNSQRRFVPDNNWLATIYHGLDLDTVGWNARGGQHLAFVGRVAPEKGIAEAIEVARRAQLPLRMVAKVYDEAEQHVFATTVQPAIDSGVVEFLGELPPVARDPVVASARATLMLGAWPEPFGLVAIESMAAGTPVIARRAGALTETVEHGVDGFLVDDVDEALLALHKVDELDRSEIRRRALARFSRDRMVDEYEAIYRRLVVRDATSRDLGDGLQLEAISG